MKKIIFIATVLLSVLSFSQNDTLVLGAEYKSQKKTSFEGFIGYDSIGIYSLDYEYISKKKQVLYLNKHDKNTLNLIYTKNITPTVSSSEYIEPLEIFNLNNRIFLIAKYVFPEKDLKRIAIFPITSDGELEEILLLDTIFSLQEKVNDFRIVASEKDQTFILITRRPFFKSHQTSYNIRKYNQQFEPVWEDIVTLPYEAKNFEFKDIAFNGDNQVMVLSKRMDVTGVLNNKLKKIENNKYNLWVYDHHGNTLKEFEISLKDKWITDIRIMYKHQKIYVAGYFSNKRDISLKGFFNIRFDSQLNMLGAKVKSMSKEDLSKFIDPDKVDTKSHLYDYYLKEAYVLDNEEIVMVGEKYYKEIDNFYNPRTDISTYTDVFNYNSVLISKFDSNGEKLHLIKIPKYQSTVNDNGYYSSITYGVSGNNVWVFFNDAEKNVWLGNDMNAKYRVLYNNRKVVPIFVKIDQKNQVTRKPVNIPEDGFLFVPRYSDQLYNKDFYLLRERGRSAKIVRFKVF